MNAQAALKYLRQVKKAAVITGGDRSDLALAALNEGDVSALILTGFIQPDFEGEKFLILTHKKHIEKFNDVITGEDSYADIDSPDTYLYSRRHMNSFLKEANEKIISKYSRMILHLLTEGIDDVNAKEANDHNFKTGVLGGIMDGYWQDRGDCCSFIANAQKSEEFLRCSDIFTDIVDYPSIDNVCPTTLELIKKIINA